MKVPGCPPCTKQQLMPFPAMQPLAAHYGMPTPDNQWFCQQPAVVIHASTATQPPIATGPYPAPTRQFQLAHYGMPTPDNQWFCQQPAAVIHASTATQPPMAAGPYPAPIQQFQPAPCRTLTGNKLPIPAMMSHFSAPPQLESGHESFYDSF